MENAFPPGRHSTNFTFNPNFQIEKRICGYEHCIESMPFSNQGIDCPVFGHDCPGGISQVQICKRKKDEPPSTINEKSPSIKLHPMILKKCNERTKRDVSSIEDILRSHMPKLKMMKVHLGLLERREGGTIIEFQESIKGCKKILEEFISEVEDVFSREEF
jgi:hypothetical protein